MVSIALPQVEVQFRDRRHVANTMPSGEYGELEERLKRETIPGTSIVINYAFDPRTRRGPFVGSDYGIINCGARMIGVAMKNAGYLVRIVLGTWNPEFDIRHARLNGRVPDVLGISSMQIHTANALRQIGWAASIEGRERPLIVVGGPAAGYDPWEFFQDPKRSAHVAIKGEVNTALEFFDRISDYRGRNDTMLEAFERARSVGALESIPGIMYQSTDGEVLIDTGKPRIVKNLDEFPRDYEGFELVESRSKTRKGLKMHPATPKELRRQGATIASMFMSQGCSLDCPYCSIPEKAQWTERAKSPERIVEDFKGAHRIIRPSSYFSTADNCLTHPREYLERKYEALANATVDGGKRFRDAIRWGTEATQCHAKNHMDLFPLMRAGGKRAIHFGIEDLTHSLIKKGQSPEKTKEVFSRMIESGIAPMPMMMHFDGQPLKSPGRTLDGLLNQVRFLHEHGAACIQTTYNSPSPGSRDFEAVHYSQGRVLAKVGNIVVENCHRDGNLVVSSKYKDEERFDRQRNIELSYRAFFNNRNFAGAVGRYISALARRDSGAKDVAEVAILNQWRARSQLRITKRNQREWMAALKTGPFVIAKSAPKSSIPIVRAGEYDAVRTVSESVAVAGSYELHAESLYQRFQQGVAATYAEHKDDVAKALESVSVSASEVMTNLSELASRARGRAKVAVSNVRERVSRELEHYMAGYVPIAN